MSSDKKIYRLVLSAMFLTAALLLPFLTGQIPQLGGALLPMHLPVLLCGYFCGPWYALGVGLLAPLLRFLLFGMPTLVPTGIAMCLELATYGLIAGILYRCFPKKKAYIYFSLIGAMIAGRVVWGATRVALMGLGGSEFTWNLFFAGAFASAIPGIILQLVLIPVIVMILQKYTVEQ